MLYIPLYIKTEYSLLDSIIRIKELVKVSKELGYKALAITDNNLFGVYEFYRECIQNDIKPIIGLEVEIDKLKIVLYAKGNVGYKNLIKVYENIDNYSIEILNKYSEDLICILPYESLKLYNDLNKIYKDLFVGYKNKEQQEKTKNYKNIYMKETLYINKNDKIYYLYLKGIKERITINEIDDDSDNYLDINIENIDLINYQYIYDNCDIKIEKDNDLLPIYEVPKGYDAFNYLKEQCKLGLKKRFGERVKKIYIDRLKYELSVIKQMGFCNYFLIVMDYVKFAKESGILVGPGRGSAAGSLVAYVTEITDVDPIKYNLLFERFLNPNRVTMPDIDIDFEYDRREEVIDYCIKKYGEKKVAGIITFGTLASRQVIRDVGRVMDLDPKEIDSFAKLIDSKLSLKENYNNEKIKNILNRNKEMKDLYKISLKLEGIKRHTSVHPAGIVMSNKNLDEVLPIVKKDNMYLTCFTMNYLEELGLLKMDFLALKNLSLITSIINDLKKDNINIEFDKIPLNDIKTYQIFEKANTVGIFQFESEGMKNFLRKLKPNNIEDLSIALALYRPGPMNNIDLFIKRKEGKEKIDYIDDRLEDILKPTYGIIVYQEQIMKISNIMANYSLGEADILRRAMSKKKEEMLLKEKDKFIDGSIKNGFKKETSIKVYNLILKFADYGFNRAHSYAYAIISYKMAYLKANYNKYFMKSLLDNVIGTISTKEYIYEAKINDIKILKPDINLSSNLYIVEKEGLRFPLSCIKNIGYNACITILEERKNGIFKDIFDFVNRVYSMKVNKKTIISLINAGCFDSFNINRKTLIENIDIIINYADIYKELGEDLEKPNLIEYEEYDNKILLNKELDAFGFYLSNHPVQEYKLKDKKLISLNEIKNNFDKLVNIVVVIDKIKIVNTKNNEQMCFITGSDEFDSIDIVLFPKTYQKYNKFNIDDIIKINGRVEKRFDKYQIVVNSIN
ncbi:MAG: DNA polymerase III subunit alpha [Bacilli bacterium]|nr:DNA polymerase III subunit alpha [Bacilli bacterium]